MTKPRFDIFNPDELFDCLMEQIESLKERVEALENGKKSTRKKGTKTDGTRIKEVFLAEYERVHGHPYPKWAAKEQATATRFVAEVGLETALEYATLYPHWKQKFVMAKGHPFELLPKFFVELVAHRKRYPKLVEEIARTRARETVIAETVEKNEELRLYGQINKGGLDPSLSFGGVGQVPVEGGEQLSLACDRPIGGEIDGRASEGTPKGGSA